MENKIMSTPLGHNRVQRSSTRPSRPANPHGLRVVVCEGHGELIQSSAGVSPRFRVPAGIEIVIFGMGMGLDDNHGVIIGQGGGLPARLPTEWDSQGSEYDTSSAGGAVRVNTPGRRIYHVGDLCPDLTLYAYNETGMPTITPPQPGSYSASVGNPVTLRAICEQYREGGAQIHWAACTVNR
ncbi:MULTISPECIES: putative adhesin [Xanthomonas translucens group]|uniref:putative adhesin n=1 Tax=Xanthomonas translucens group TaxID=3390202 RepID=UPI003964842D